MSVKFHLRRETALQRSSGGGYVSSPCSSRGLAPEPGRDLKENDGERARALPLGEHVPGFPGGNLAGHGSPVPAQRRQSRSSAAAPEAHRGQGGRRAPAHVGRLPEGPLALRRQRGRGARTAAALLGELIGIAVLAAACDQGKQADQRPIGGAVVHLVGTNLSPTRAPPPPV